ncbi:MAG: hypothetical protein EP343_08380 [Deltaproteobacteria bacterium]|nr:MAG: hypothetical protein EP343_08380 [Deltaproteobacteria bacterium]
MIVESCWNLRRVRPLLWVGVFVLGGLYAIGCGKELADLGAPCLFSSDCKVQYRCVSERCATGKSENDSCGSSIECNQGLSCVEKKCQFDGKACSQDSDCTGKERCTGRKCLEPAGSGSPCLDTKGCLAPFVCDTKGVCVDTGKPGTKGTGEACEKAEDCQRGLACDPNDKKCIEGGGVGAPCKSSQDCNTDLACANTSVCAKKGDPGTAGAGEDCTVPTDCQATLTCGTGGKCASNGLLGEGSNCAGNENCEQGLLCATVKGSTTGQCSKPGGEGTKLPGEECANPLDCTFGSVCGFDNKCALVRPFTANTCPVSAEEDKGDSRVLFEVPKDKVEEFFRLPYPNDIRLGTNGLVDLKGFPNPGPLLGEDLVGKYIQAIQAELKGFSTNPTITFRLSKPIDFNSVELNTNEPGIIYVNLDTDQRTGFNVSYNSGRTPYICGSHLQVRAPNSRVLEGGQTYAVLIMNSVKDSGGTLLKRDKDFDAVMQDSAPSDSNLAKAHGRYQKLRDWLKKNETDGKFPKPSDVIAGAVFTTHKPTETFAKFRDVVFQQQAPTLKDVVLCKDGVKSPCESENEVTSRSCGKSDGTYHEIHAKLSIPIFQQGKAPYKTEGGNIEMDGSGAPKVARTEDVCVAITIPKADPPTEGWPVVIYAHGTGGNLRSHIADRTAERLTEVKSGDKTVRFATIGIDQVVHGLRRGDDTTHPNFLFFNFRNPQASLGNTLQNAADQYALVRWLQGFKMEAKDSPIQKDIAFNKRQITFLGHSQGGFAGPLFLAYSKEVKAAVLSGAGGGLLYSLLGKTSPINIAAGVRALLGEKPSSRIDANHPVLNLFQHYFDRADAINYGKLLFQKPPQDIPPKHILQIYGKGDTFTPKDSTIALAQAMGVEHAGPAPESLGSFSSNSLKLPAKGNKSTSTGKITAIFTQYEPGSGQDGHFVTFNNTSAISHFTGFLASFLTDAENVPTVP